MVSVTQLKPYPKEDNPYGRTLKNNPPPIREGKEGDNTEYEVERIVGKRYDGRRKYNIYLIK